MIIEYKINTESIEFIGDFSIEGGERNEMIMSDKKFYFLMLVFFKIWNHVKIFHFLKLMY